MGIKDFFVRKMMERKLKDVPKEQQEQIMSIIDKNPDLFKKIGEEIEAKIKAGKPELYATMDVMKKYQSELQKLSQH
ncbi:MAG: hypothetical protein COV34_01990 [Candidatus Zambryskibacteria bacterium CG10_big_fil_rev_8_21_14_0_10_42_12]|uniref:Uncharacterized protein n=1 Tax=Candidatus Zambryskibacteria bacterium CG10_big_fil_rev_8_21_14_0_10_42_12 TaxID=1975115 RepID=A0A2H0QWJ1_9BACT|nr:MAG: hypothetical protein COV34_01990 [Candidatus Zambryskibacteria bacterium CG10_big_fil_rev_8_21_14_0_10_42_12]